EYAVKAIALHGSAKALRLIEFYTRKYKTTYKNIGAAANESFELVAEELDISPYDLADTIVPDFDFEGLFKSFEVSGETYRAFVNTDFKLVFLDESNKIIKSLPKETSPALKEAFKDTAKEIKDLLKPQTTRLEQYLIIQRRWESSKWESLFRQNPVMFVYAVRIVWGAYSPDGNLLYTFRCEEDQSLVTINGEEIEVDESLKIGLVHPISLDTASIAYWSQNLLDAGITPVFPQLLRPVTLLNTNEQTLKMSNTFVGVESGGAAFLGKMTKSGWNKMVADAGLISSYYKGFPQFGIIAFVEQTGMHGIGLYQENAVMGRVYFVKEIVIKPGAYYYDDPSSPGDPRLIPFGDVPPIMYSEVMADLQYFK
ncbi:MAG: hypothetical protein RI894_302, partial [Bacteroidota bacterium]